MKKRVALVILTVAVCAGGCCPAKPIKDTANLVANKGGLAKLDIKNCKNGDSAACDKAEMKIDEITSLIDALSKKMGKGGDQ